MKLTDKFYEKHRIKMKYLHLKWENRNLATKEVVNRTYREGFLRNWFENQEEIDNFKSNLYKVLNKEKLEDRHFGIRGEQGYNRILDFKIIRDSLIYRDGIVLGYEKGRELEKEKYEEELKKAKSPDLLEVERRDYFLRKRDYYARNIVPLGIMIILAFGFFGSKGIDNKFKDKIEKLNQEKQQIINFYQANGVCPKDSSSVDFIEWQKLWEESFDEKTILR